jgi:hypothetical protein
MSIDYSELRSLTARRLISALTQDGFNLPSQDFKKHNPGYGVDGRGLKTIRTTEITINAICDEQILTYGEKY